MADCPKCGYPYMKRDVPGGLKKGCYKGIYTPGKKCDGCGYRDKAARRARERLHALLHAPQLRVTTRKAAGRTHTVEVELNVDSDLQLHFPNGGRIEIRLAVTPDGYAEIYTYDGRMLLRPVSGNVIAVRPELWHGRSRKGT